MSFIFVLVLVELCLNRILVWLSFSCWILTFNLFFSHHRYHITQTRFYSCNVAAAVQQSAGNVGGFYRKWFHFVLRIS